MKEYPISIVIPCSSDLLLEQCINSIDSAVEVIVSLGRPTPEVKQLLTKFPDVKIVETDQLGIAISYNKGIEIATNDWILLMDSDCTFSAGAIDKMWQLTDNFRIVRGKVAFRATDLISSITSRLREFTTSDNLNAYSPPLLFNKDIVNQIGYYFRPELVWAEDADFNNRVQSNHIALGYAPEAIIFHRPLSFRRDLRSAFYYGVGRQIGKSLGVYKPHSLKTFANNVGLVLANTGKILARKGLLPAMYYFFLWNPAFRIGTFLQLTVGIIKSEPNA